jgi:hypothetical protein
MLSRVMISQPRRRPAVSVGVEHVGVCYGAGWPLPLVDDGAGAARVGQVVAEAGEELAEAWDVSVDVEADLGRALGHAAACCDSS